MSYEFTAPIKDPSAVLDHGMDWRGWLEDGETITGTPTVVPQPAGLTIAQVVQANGIVSWRVSGGVLGQGYITTCTITTSIGRIEERSVLYTVGNR